MSEKPAAPNSTRVRSVTTANEAPGEGPNPG